MKLEPDDGPQDGFRELRGSFANGVRSLRRAWDDLVRPLSIGSVTRWRQFEGRHIGSFGCCQSR
jgi:hypothetical protein